MVPGVSEATAADAVRLDIARAPVQKSAIATRGGGPMICPNDYCRTELGLDALRCQLCGAELFSAPEPEPLRFDDDAEAPAAEERATTAAYEEDDAAAPTIERWPFEFTGETPEYFRIWFVNVALTIATVGIYSAWAKVRTTRYFYGNTRVGDASFEYLANPLAILKGRLLAALIFGLYWLAGDLLAANIALSLAFTCALPWMMVRGLAFRAHNSAYRNLRFRFGARYLEAAVAYVLRPLLALVTLGLLYPAARFHQQRFVVDHAAIGASRFHLDATAGDFYEMYVKYALCVFIGGVVALVSLVLGMLVIAIPAALFLWWAYFDLSASFQNLVYDRTRLGAHRLISTLDGSSLFALYAVNTVAMLGSFGLLVPWARIRTARYRASRLVLATTGGLGGLLAAQAGDVSAVGSEVADIFDVDLGF